MASDKIKGLTIKIGADTSDFVKELKKVDKEINATQKSAANLQKGLELKYDETRFIQAQKQVQKALEQTEQKASAIRQQMKLLEDSGQIDTKAYETLQDQLAQTENKALELEQQLRKLDDIKFDALNKGLQDTAESLNTAANKTKYLSAAAAGALAGMTALAKSAVKTGDDIQTTADQYNVTAEAIQRLNYIALQSDVPTQQLYKGMTKARDAIGTALAGETNNAIKALENLVGDLSKLPTDTEGAFFAIINALADVKDSTLQAYYANEIFGEKMAVDLIPMVKKGSETLRGYAEEFETVGYLTNEQVAELSAFDNEMNQVNTQFDNAKTQLGIALIPVLETFVGLLREQIIPVLEKLSQWFSNLSKDGQQFIIVGLGITAMLSPVLKLLSSVIGVIPNLVKWLKNLNAQTLTTAAGFAALGGAIALSLNLIADWRKMSTVEKILKALAVAALVAAAAVTVFHAAWSWGIAVGAITAGVVAGVAAIKAAADEIGVDADFSDTDSITRAANVGTYSIPSQTSSTPSSYTEDNSQYNIEINFAPSGDLDYDAKSLAEEVIKEIQIKKQAGRG